MTTQDFCWYGSCASKQCMIHLGNVTTLYALTKLARVCSKATPNMSAYMQTSSNNARHSHTHDATAAAAAAAASAASAHNALTSSSIHSRRIPRRTRWAVAAAGDQNFCQPQCTKHLGTLPVSAGDTCGPAAMLHEVTTHILLQPPLPLPLLLLLSLLLLLLLCHVAVLTLYCCSCSCCSSASLQQPAAVSDSIGGSSASQAGQKPLLLCLRRYSIHTANRVFFDSGVSAGIRS
jgi:hypothetical protein